MPKTMIMSALENSTMLRPCEAAGKLTLLHLWQRLTNSVVTAIRIMSKSQHQRRVLAELDRFDDRLLKDIGISRAEIQSVVLTGRSGGCTCAWQF